MKSKTSSTKKNTQWIGIILLFLALLSLFFIIIANRRVKKPIIRQPRPVVIDEIDVDSVDDENLFETLDFQNVHTKFQKSYLDLVQKITSREPDKNSKDGTIRIDVKKESLLFENYKRAQSNYEKVLKKIENNEKDYKLKCFARMRKIILGVLYADKKLKKRVTKFDAEKMVEIGALDEVPICPRGGEYSIIYKNGRRLFNCSIHGVLKN